MYCGRSQDYFAAEHPGVVLICDEVETVDVSQSLATFATGRVFHFSRCTRTTYIERRRPTPTDSVSSIKLAQDVVLIGGCPSMFTVM